MEGFFFILMIIFVVLGVTRPSPVGGILKRIEKNSIIFLEGYNKSSFYLKQLFQ